MIDSEVKSQTQTYSHLSGNFLYASARWTNERVEVHHKLLKWSQKQRSTQTGVDEHKSKEEPELHQNTKRRWGAAENGRGWFILLRQEKSWL